MGCGSSQVSSTVNGSRSIPDQKRYKRREDIKKARLEKQSRPDKSLNTSKITSTVYRLHPDSTPTITAKKKKLLYLAERDTFLSPPSSPIDRAVPNPSLASYEKPSGVEQTESPQSPPLLFSPNKPFSVTNRLQQLYKKLKYQLEPMAEDEITHEEERHDAMMLYGQHAGIKTLKSALQLLNSNEDNLFLHKIVWQSICRDLATYVQAKEHVFAILSTIIAAFYGNDAAFFAFTSAQSFAVYLLFLCTAKLTGLRREAGEQLGTENMQAKSIEACYEYLFSNANSREKSGLSIARTLLHTYVVNRYIFNTHYSALYADSKMVDLHKQLYEYSVVVEPPQFLDDIYTWGKAWLSNDKQHAKISKIMSVPPSPTNSTSNDAGTTIDPGDQINDAGADANDSTENNALRTYEKQILASQNLYDRLRVDIKNKKGFADDDFSLSEARENNKTDKDGQYLVDYEIVRVLEFNRSDPHIFMQLYTHWRKEKYTPQDLVDMNALTCVLGVLQRANPENIIYGSIVTAATMCLLYTMEGPNAFERLIQSETKRLQNEERSKRRDELKRDVENYSNGISKVTLTGRSKTGSNRNLRALQTLANAGSTIHDAYIWADSNSELFPNTRKTCRTDAVPSTTWTQTARSSNESVKPQSPRRI